MTGVGSDNQVESCMRKNGNGNNRTCHLDRLNAPFTFRVKCLMLRDWFVG